jgi:hypothetical protein
MHFNQIALLVATLAVSTQAAAVSDPSGGFFVPRDTPEGAYIVTYDAAGKATHTKVDENNFLVKSDPETLPKADVVARQAPGDRVSCGINSELNHGNLDAANAALDVDCGGNDGAGVPAGADYYRYNGNSVAFFCNRGGNNRCDAGARRETSARITARCGWYKPGWVDLSDWKISYGYDFADRQFCGRNHPR